MKMVAFIVLVQVASSEIVAEHVIRPYEDRTEFRTKCGSYDVSFKYRNKEYNRDAVESVKIHGREVPNAARTLSVQAINRHISSIVVKECGFGKEAAGRVIGMMEMVPEPPIRGGRSPRVYFEMSPSVLTILFP